jgi:hypothetical protein
MHDTAASEPSRPHIPYYFEGYRFTPWQIAVGEREAWVADMHLPVLARVERATGEITGPHLLKRPDGSQGNLMRLAMHRDCLCARWAEGVTFFDLGSGEQRTLAIPGTHLAAGPEGVWTVTHRAGLVRVDRHGIQQSVEIPPFPYCLTVGHGAVWVVSWTNPQEGRIVVSRINPRTGGITAAVELSGSPKHLVSDRTGIWANVWVQHPACRQITSHLIGLDPQTAEVTSDIDLEPTGAFGPIIDGEIWLQSTDPFDHAARGRPTTIRRVSAADGRLLGAVELDGWLTWPVAGPGSVWGRVERRSDARTLSEIDTERQQVRYFDLGHLDVSTYLPPPPPSIEARDMERQVRDRLTDSLFGGWIRTNPETGEELERLPYIRGVTFEEVRLEGRFPQMEIVVLFRADEHPGLVFDRRRRIWEDDGALSGVIDVMDVNLMEDVEACGHGLPEKPVADASGIAWF